MGVYLLTSYIFVLSLLLIPPLHLFVYHDGDTIQYVIDSQFTNPHPGITGTVVAADWIGFP